jgi:hypothetical protein
MAVRGERTGFQAYAQELVPSTLTSNILSIPVLIAVMSRKGQANGELGRPGAAAMIGNSFNIGEVKTIDGSDARHIRFQTGTVGGGKYLSEDGTTASTGTERADKKVRTAHVQWAFWDQPITIRNMTLRKAGSNRFKIADAIQEATGMAMQEAMDTLGTDIWSGSPSDYDADVYDTIAGMADWLDDDNNAFGVNRSSVSGFSAIRDDTSTAAALKLIDDIKVGNASNLADFGGKGDVVITTNAVYNKLKQEAINRNQIAGLTANAMPEAGQIGFLSEYFMYNGTMVTFDPKAPSGYLAVLDSTTWSVEVHPDENFSVKEFTDLSVGHGQGKSDTTQSSLRIGMRTVCEAPRRNALYTSVS